ncbi:CBO0543 family protein [Halalkalibacter urbisdiaboli]|uniref:CBO0543 family protein n=1 Tax=Halalkalibacter urbisdiaboli TaxID=1960589 RepID=UPI000B4306A7|nr:CBO0543 family protein [Halalkalibacter urbisdiaboli]
MHIIYNALFLLGGWRWGDWRNWEKYYPTILFFILSDLLHNFLTYNHQFWHFQENVFPLPFLNHTTISLIIMFVCYPVTILIYLGYFFKTNKWKKRIFYFVFWVMLYLSVEYINLYIGLISHHNSWNMWHSVLFVIFMFIIFPIHYKKPLLAWIISGIVLIFILTQFELPLDKMK